MLRVQVPQPAAALDGEVDDGEDGDQSDGRLGVVCWQAGYAWDYQRLHGSKVGSGATF